MKAMMDAFMAPGGRPHRALTLGGLFATLGKDRRALHDYLGGTVVLRPGEVPQGFAPILAQPVAPERGGDLVALLAQQAGDDERLGRAGHDGGDVEQQRAHEVRDDVGHLVSPQAHGFAQQGDRFSRGFARLGE